MPSPPAPVNQPTGSDPGPPVVVTREGARVELTLNRPWRRNALTPDLVEAALAAVAAVRADDTVGAVVLRGAGGTFCSGIDLKELGPGAPAGEVRRFGVAWRQLHVALAGLEVPIVGALERAAIAGGSALALACDLLVAGEDAVLHISEVELGRAAPINVAWLVYKHGQARALEAVLAAPRYQGAALRDAGLAHAVVPDDTVVDAARALADRLAGHDRAAVVALKASVRRADGRSFADLIEAATPPT